MRFLVVCGLFWAQLCAFAQSSKAEFEKYAKEDPLSGKMQFFVNDSLWQPGKLLPPVSKIKIQWMPTDTSLKSQYQMAGIFLMLGTEHGINRKINIPASEKSKIPNTNYDLNIPKMVSDTIMTIGSIQAGLIFQIDEAGKVRRMLLGRKNLVLDFKIAPSKNQK